MVRASLALVVMLDVACQDTGLWVPQQDGGVDLDSGAPDATFDAGADRCPDGGPTVYVAVVSRPATTCPDGVYIRRYVIGSDLDYVDIPCPTCLCTIDIPFGVSVSLGCAFPGAATVNGLIVPAPDTCDFHQDFLCETY